MTTDVDPRVPPPAPPRRRHRQRGGFLLTGVGVAVVAVLVVAAGFTHPWNSGAGITDGTYSSDYSLTEQAELTDLGRCFEVTVAGTLSATYRSPTWSLGGPGWVHPRLSDTSVTVTSTQGCADSADSAALSQVRLTQFWAGQTCAEPDRERKETGGWTYSTPLGRCDRDLVAGISGSFDTSGSRFQSTFSGFPLTWGGTVYSDSLCVNGAVLVEATVGRTSDDVQADGFRACLDPQTAELT